MPATMTFSDFVMTAPAPVENPDIFTATISRTGATFWFTILALSVLGIISAASKSSIAAWLMLAAGALGLGVIVITSGPLLEIGDSVRNWLRGLSDDPRTGELFGGAAFTIVLLIILYLCISSRKKNPVLSLVVAIIVSAMLFTSPTLQGLALRYADSVAVPVMRALMA